MNSAREHIMKGSAVVEDYQDLVEGVLANATTVTPDPVSFVSTIVHNSTPYTPVSRKTYTYDSVLDTFCRLEKSTKANFAIKQL